jgi:hypothetical protein
MRLTAIIPSMLDDRRDDFEYRCSSCGAEAKRQQKRAIETLRSAVAKCQPYGLRKRAWKGRY